MKGLLFERGAYWKEGAKSNHGFGRHLDGLSSAWKYTVLCVNFFLSLRRNREFAQFFLAVALKKAVVTTAQLLQFVPHSSISCDPVYLAKNKNQTDPRYISWPIISRRLYTVLYREILIFCAAFWREYSCICNHYVLRFTSLQHVVLLLSW